MKQQDGGRQRGKPSRNDDLLQSIAQLRAQRLQKQTSAETPAPAPSALRISALDLSMARRAELPSPATSSSAGSVVDLTDSPDSASTSASLYRHEKFGGAGRNGRTVQVQMLSAEHGVARSRKPEQAPRSDGAESKAVSCEGSVDSGSSASARQQKNGDIAADLVNRISSLNLDPVVSRTEGKGSSKRNDLGEREGQNSVVPASDASALKIGKDELRLVTGNYVFVLPAKIATVLYPHQREGIRWLWGLHVRKTGGILGDDMGLGKTLQMVAFLAGLFLSQQIKRVLIVAPKTLIKHWAKELSSVDLGRKTKDFSGSSVSFRNAELDYVLKFGGVLLTTYDMVRVNWKALRGRPGSEDDEFAWDYIVLDEGHLIKNTTTERTKSLHEIPSIHRIILTGTPIQNKLREMWALFDFCCPELLGDWQEFKLKYDNPILHGNDKTASDRVKKIGSAAAQKLREQIAPVFLRRMKSEVFPNTNSSEDKLPHKKDLIVWLRLSKWQQQLYRAFLNSQAARSVLDGTNNPLAAMTVLKKICDHPLMLTKKATKEITEGMEGMMDTKDRAEAENMASALAELVDVEEGFRTSHALSSCKIEFLIALLEKLVQNGHRTLIFAQTRRMLDFVQEEITKKNYRFVRIDGLVKACDREHNVEVGGLGLTLTGADRVIIVDPNWNPSVDNQSVDRAYRIGQTKDVIIYRLISCSTIEEKVYRNQVFKGGLMKVATEKKETFRYFSQRDLQEIFSVPSCGFDVSRTQQQLHQEHASQYRVEKELRAHIQFLEKLPVIAGVSHHDLLFSKTAPELPPESEEKTSDVKNKGAKQNPASEAVQKACHEVGDLKQTIRRLTRTLEDEDTIKKLPDGGLNIVRRLKDLSAQLIAAEAKAEALGVVFLQ